MNTPAGVNVHLPSPDKSAYYVFGIILGAVMFYFIGRWLGKLTVKDQSTVDDLKKDINSKNLSFQISQYGIFADGLYQAMKGAGTDENYIYGVFDKMKNNDDVKQLIVSFGKREAAGIIWPDVYNLPEYLKDDLSAGAIAKVNTILSKKGISIQF